MKKSSLSTALAALLLAVCFLTACTGKQTAPLTAESVRQLHPTRVVSLAPSVTEIVCAVGAEDMLVGRTDYCNYPASVAAIPSVGSYTSPNVELIVEKSPNLVIASGSISDDIRKQLEGIGIAVYVTQTASVSDIKAEILNVGTMLGKDTEAGAVVAEMNRKSAAIQKRKEALQEKKSVFCDLGSFYTCSSGAFLDGVLTEIGLRNIAAGADRPWIQLSAELVVQGNPDVYLSFYTPAEQLQNSSALAPLSCLQNGGLLVLDYELADILQREGPRIVDGEWKLMEIIYGKQ